MPSVLSFAAGAAVGAAAAYFLDPQGGAKRRSATRDKTVSTVGPRVGDVAASAREAAGKAQGKVASAVPDVVRSKPDDATLVDKVESHIFRAHDAPKGQVNVNAENGVVFLRGQLDDQAWIDRLASEAQEVDGVRSVRNLLHRPGTPAA